MIVELLASGMAENLNLSVDFAFGKGLHGAFKTNRRIENPNAIWLWSFNLFPCFPISLFSDSFYKY